MRNQGFISRITESRLDLKGNPVELPRGRVRGQGVFAPAFRISSGFASSTFHFATSFQSDSTFRYVGDERIGNQNTFVVAFAQRPSDAAITVPWSTRASNVHILVQ